MDIDQFRAYIVRDALKTAGWWSQAAENLILGTAIAESNLSKLIQVGCGVARGVWQIEGRSYVDLLGYIKRNPGKAKTILSVCNMATLPDNVDAVISNLRYACLIARMFYYRVPDPIPAFDDASAMCNYYIQHYNCGGKATAERDLPIFRSVCSNKDW